jgi:hypothetical protein
MSELYDKFACPSDEIAAYIDGELDASHEREMDAHLAVCAACVAEMNLQKQFLCSLESSLKHDGDIELPRDFAKHIVANAESTVSGLRPPRERLNAIFICAALVLFILFALGSEAGRVFDGASGGIEQIAAVAGFFGHFIYSFFIGVAIVLRTFATQIRPEVLAVALISVVAVISLAFISQKLLRMHRA